MSLKLLIVYDSADLLSEKFALIDVETDSGSAIQFKVRESLVS